MRLLLLTALLASNSIILASTSKDNNTTEEKEIASCSRIGPTGPRGEKGFDGRPGPRGPEGRLRGPTGPTGPMGHQNFQTGPVGRFGDFGSPGLIGDTGPTGPKNTHRPWAHYFNTIEQRQFENGLISFNIAGGRGFITTGGEGIVATTSQNASQFLLLREPSAYLVTVSVVTIPLSDGTGNAKFALYHTPTVPFNGFNFLTASTRVNGTYGAFHQPSSTGFTGSQAVTLTFAGIVTDAGSGSLSVVCQGRQSFGTPLFIPFLDGDVNAEITIVSLGQL